MLHFLATSRVPTKQKLIDKLKMMPKDSAQQQTKHLIDVVKPLRLIEDKIPEELKPQEAAIEILTTVSNLYKNHIDFYYAIESGIELSPQTQSNGYEEETESVENLEKQKSLLKNKIENAKATDKPYFDAMLRVEKEDIKNAVEIEYGQWVSYEEDVSTYQTQSTELTDVVAKSKKQQGKNSNSKYKPQQEDDGKEAPHTPHKGTRSKTPKKPTPPNMNYNLKVKIAETVAEMQRRMKNAVQNIIENSFKFETI